MMRAPEAAHRRTAVVAALLAAGVLLTACAGDGNGDSGGGQTAAKSAPGAAQRDTNDTREHASGGGGQEAASTSSRTSARVLPAPRDIIYRGDITVRVKSVPAAAARTEQIARAAGGEVFAEETSTEGSTGTSRAHLTLRVPPEDFRRVLSAVARLGKRLNQSQTAEDVTTQVVDTQSRIATQKRSVARVRALLDQATTIGQVVQVESEVARREADLESLEAQLARLKDVTAMATIEVNLVGADAPAPEPEDEDLGFMSGFRNGWDAFVQIVLVGLTVVGALLPFALAMTLVGLPAWLVFRSRLRRRTMVTPEAPAA